MKERLKQIRKNLGLSQEEFGKKIGIESRAHISSLENGTRNITDRIIKDICREFDINEEWLRTGRGEMRRDLTIDEEIISFMENVQRVPDDTYEKKFILMLSKLDKSDWETLEKMARLMLE